MADACHHSPVICLSLLWVVSVQLTGTAPVVIIDRFLKFPVLTCPSTTAKERKKKTLPEAKLSLFEWWRKSVMSFCSGSVKFRCEEAKGKAERFKSESQRLHNSGYSGKSLESQLSSFNGYSVGWATFELPRIPLVVWIPWFLCLPRKHPIDDPKKDSKPG